MREGGRQAKQAAYVDIEGKMYSLTTDLTRVESRDIVADIIVEQSDLAFLHSSYARVVMSCDHTRPVMVAMLRGIYCTLVVPLFSRRIARAGREESRHVLQLCPRHGQTC